MTTGLKSWLEKLADKPIPIKKQYRDQALEILNDEDRSAAECQSVISADPGIAANLLKAMNTERQAAGRLPITTVNSLISLFGVPRLLAELNTMVCYEELDLPQANLDGIERCLKQSWYCDAFAMCWAQERQMHEPAEVHLGAILQSLPELMLWSYGADVMRDIEHNAYFECKDYYYEVSKFLGCHKRQIGAELARQWHLPEAVTFGFESEYNSFTTGTAIGLAALLARLCLHGWYGQDMTFFLEKAMHYFGENEVRTIKHIHQNALDMAYDEIEKGYRPVASLLLATNLERIPEIEYRKPDVVKQGSKTEPEAGVAEKVKQSVVKEEVAAADKPSREQINLPGDESAEPVAKQLISINRQQLSEDFIQLTEMIKQSTSLNELLKQVVISLHDTVKFDRVSFLLLSQDKARLESKLNMFSNADDDSLKQLSIPLSQKDLFSLLLKKPQAFNLNENNFDKYWSLVPGVVKSAIHVDRFCVASVVYKNKPLGMIYADRIKHPASNDEFAAFQKMTMLLNKGLELQAKK